MHILKLALCFAVIVTCAHSLACLCHEGFDYECREIKEEDCPYGITNDECGCCKTCTKGPGEICGGYYIGFISCSSGYECIPDERNFEQVTFNTLHFCGQLQGTLGRSMGGSTDTSAFIGDPSFYLDD